MDTATLRERLHNYIDHADDVQLVTMFDVVEGGQNRGYSDATIQMLHERRDEYLRGDGESYTVEESMRWIKEQGDNEL